MIVDLIYSKVARVKQTIQLNKCQLSIKVSVIYKSVNYLKSMGSIPISALRLFGLKGWSSLTYSSTADKLVVPHLQPTIFQTRQIVYLGWLNPIHPRYLQVERQLPVCGVPMTPIMANTITPKMKPDLALISWAGANAVTAYEVWCWIL